MAAVDGVEVQQEGEIFGVGEIVHGYQFKVSDSIRILRAARPILPSPLMATLFMSVAAFVLTATGRRRVRWNVPISAGVGESAAGLGLRGYPDRLGDLFGRGSGSCCQSGMSFDALGALGEVSDSDGDQLLGLAVQRAAGEDRASELVERPARPGVRLLSCALTSGGAG